MIAWNFHNLPPHQFNAIMDVVNQSSSLHVQAILKNHDFYGQDVLTIAGDHRTDDSAEEFKRFVEWFDPAGAKALAEKQPLKKR